MKPIVLKKEIPLNVILKGLTAVLNFLIIPLTIEYLSPSRYGLYLTLVSIMGFSGLLDLGTGGAIRVKYGEVKANKDWTNIKAYLSTAYFFLLLVGFGLFFLLLLIQRFYDWGQVINVPEALKDEFYTFTIVFFAFFSIKLAAKLIHVLYMADLRTYISSLIYFIGSLATYAVIFGLLKFGQGSLVKFMLITGSIEVLLLFSFTFAFFRRGHRAIRPAWKDISFSKCRDIFRLSRSYFVMQFSMVIVMSADNLLVSSLFGPEEVASYHFLFKYFILLATFFTTIRLPLFGAYTVKFFEEDMSWVRTITRKLLLLWLGLVFIGLGMWRYSTEILNFFLEEKLVIPQRLNDYMFVFVLMYSFKGVFSMFLGSIGKVRLSEYHSIFIMLFNIPLSIFLVKYFDMGVEGILLGTILCTAPEIIHKPIQYYKITRGVARGIWNK